MKCIFSCLSLTIAMFCSSLVAQQLVIPDMPKGLFVEDFESAQPDQSGVLLTRDLVLPDFECGSGAF